MFFAKTIKEQRTVDEKNPNALLEFLTGSGTDSNNEDLELIERHGINVSTRQIIGLNSLVLLNDIYNDEMITKFISGWIELRQYTKDSSKNIMKTIEYRENKKFTENLNVGMNLKK